MRSNSHLHKTELGAMTYEHFFDARVRDVFKPALARLAGLGDWPGASIPLSDRSGDGARFGSVGLRQHCRLASLHLRRRSTRVMTSTLSIDASFWTPEGLSRTSRLQGRSPVTQDGQGRTLTQHPILGSWDKAGSDPQLIIDCFNSSPTQNERPRDMA
jgi:hypothetical protein